MSKPVPRGSEAPLLIASGVMRVNAGEHEAGEPGGRQHATVVDVPEFIRYQRDALTARLGTGLAASGCGRRRDARATVSMAVAVGVTLGVTVGVTLPLGDGGDVRRECRASDERGIMRASGISREAAAAVIELPVRDGCSGTCRQSRSGQHP